MKNFKNMLHILLTGASVLGFLGGWATLAHSHKPAQPVSSSAQALDPLPALAPLPAMNLNASSNNNSSGGQFTIIAPSAPRLRSRSFFSTGGS
jgi:hypothetical protein